MNQPGELGSSQKQVSLVLFSGGIDSTHALVNLLRNTDDIVLAHHVHLINREGRHKAEATACDSIVRYYRENIRKFFYSESAVDRHRFKAHGYDVMTVSTEAGIAASNYLLDTGKMPDRWILGLNQEEFNDVGTNSEGRLEHILAAIAASCYPNAPPAFHRPEIRPKAELIAEIGPELTKMCWTCRRPVVIDGGFRECGECRTCKIMAKIRGGSENKGPG